MGNDRAAILLLNNIKNKQLDSLGTIIKQDIRDIYAP